MLKAMYCLLLIITCCRPAHAGLLAQNQQTDNQKDFRNPDTADIEVDGRCPVFAGQWSYHYWDESVNQITPLGRGNPENEHFSGKWVIDNKKPEDTWWIGKDGKIRSDDRALMLIYTVDQNESGKVRIHGKLNINDYRQCHFRIFQSSDNDLYHVKAEHLKLLFDSKQAQQTRVWRTITVDSGNDICFVFQGGQDWWSTRTLIASIKIIPTLKQ